MPADFRVSITNAPGKGVYPISSFTWLLALREPEGQGAGQGDGRLREVGADRRAEVRVRARATRRCLSRWSSCELAALAQIKVSCVARSKRSGLPARDRRVRARPRRHRRRRSASSCARQSMLSIQKFGFNFWRTAIWDPVAGEFGALPFIWGTLYSSDSGAADRHAGRARHRDLHLGALSRLARAAAGLPDRAAAPPFRRSCYGLWGIFVLVPPVRALEVAARPTRCDRCRCSAARRSASACCRPR